MTSAALIQVEIDALQKILEPMQADLNTLMHLKRLAISREWVAENKVIVSQVQRSDAPGLPPFDTIDHFKTWLRNTKCKLPFAEYDECVYFTQQLRDGYSYSYLTVGMFDHVPDHLPDHVPGNTVQNIYAKYTAAYGPNLQGCCLLIADEIQREVGGEVVAGELSWYGGSCRRTHWWVEKDGQVLDPMGDEFLRTEEATGRSEAHRNRSVFDSILPQYERWRR